MKGPERPVEYSAYEPESW